MIMVLPQSQSDGTETGATMKLSTFGMPFLMSLVPAVSVAADEYGQYFCYAERFAEIGNVYIDDYKKFFLTLTAVAPPPKGGWGRNPELVAAWNKYCKATVDYYIKLLENGNSPRPVTVDNPSRIGKCFATDKLTVQYYPDDGTGFEYYGYGSEEYYGGNDSVWIEFSGGVFKMSSRV